jgi:hypothetical protein
MSAEMQTKHGGAAVITPSDTVDQFWTGIYVGGAGNLNVDMESGGTVLFTAVPVGTIMPIRVKRVRSTLTTATLLIGLQ